MSKAPARKARETVTFSLFDPAKYLKDEATIAAYLEAAAEDGDAAHYISALGDVARARTTMAGLAGTVGETRPGLVKSMSAKGNPSLATTMKVMTALGFRFTVAPAAVRPAAKIKRTAASGRIAAAAGTAAAPSPSSTRSTPQRRSR